jgi:hypothetical protein
MPTFQGVSLHPTIQSRFLQPNRQRADRQDGKNDGRQPQQGAATPPPCISGVATPRALLARSPQELVSIFSGGETLDQQQQGDLLTEMEGIRNQVALSMLAKTQSGRHILQQQQNQYQVANDASDGDHSSCNSQPLIRGGTLSGLQLLERHREQAIPSATQGPLRFSTGCQALDELVAFPADYTYGGGDEIGGLQRGYVVLITGLGGKTQLALQLAAQVAIKSSDDYVRYCYSTAGHSGYPLAQRYLQLVGNAAEVAREELGRKIQFQSITTFLDLVKSLSALEEEWLRYPELSTTGPQEDLIERPPVVLVLDSFAMMTAGEEDAVQIQSVERWLKRLARQHGLIVVCTGRGSRSEICDIHLEIQQVTPSSYSISLLRHPARLVTERDQIPCLQLTKVGMVAPD